MKFKQLKLNISLKIDQSFCNGKNKFKVAKTEGFVTE